MTINYLAGNSIVLGKTGVTLIAVYSFKLPITGMTLYEHGEKVDLWYILLSGQLHLHGGPAMPNGLHPTDNEVCSKSSVSSSEVASSRMGSAKVGNSTARPGSAAIVAAADDGGGGGGVTGAVQTGLVLPGHNLVPLRDVCAAKDRFRSSSAECVTECQFAVIAKVR